MLINPAKPEIAQNQRLREAYHRRRVLVAGADGFLGVNCVYALQALGADVSILSRRDTPRAIGFRGQVFRGDLMDRDAVLAAVTGQDVVFDFAGNSSAVQSNREPDKNLQFELRPQLSLFEACASAKNSPMLVFCSTRLVYGTPEYLPVDEAHPLAPASIYAVHKITAEHYLRAMALTHGLRPRILRLSNPYGPNLPPESKGYGLINEFIRMAMQGTPITIYGDGSQRRDYIHVDDVIIAFLLSAAADLPQTQTFNLGCRSAVSVREAVEEISRFAGGSPVRFVPWPAEYKAIETGDYQTDVSLLERMVDLPPQMSFGEGLARMKGQLATAV